MPVIYVDVVWFVNFIMDAVILVVTSWIAKHPIRWSRVSLGSVFGATYALLMFTPRLSLLTTWPGKAIASLVLVAVAIPCRSWLQLLRACLLYYFVAFVFAGAAIAVHFALPGVSVASGTVIRDNRLAFVTSAKSLALLVATPLAAGLVRYATSRIRRRQQQDGLLYRVNVTVSGEVCSFVGLADTGNQLRDPITRRPVCLVEAKALAKVLPPLLARAAENGTDLSGCLQQLQDDPFLERVCLVPYRSAGGNQQLAVAFRPDSLEIERNGHSHPTTQPCLLAIHNDSLSVEGRFQAILHIEVLTGDDGCENDATASEAEHETAHTPTVALDPHSHKTSWRG